MLKLKEFLRKFALREKQELTSVKIVNGGSIVLPYGSAVHYRNLSQVEMGIQGSNVLVRNYDSRIRVYHETENYGSEGSPTTRAFQHKKEMQMFFKKQKRFMRVPNLERVLDTQRDLLVFDYTFFNHLFKYRESAWIKYYDWLNTANALVKRINESGSVRHHYVYLEMPDVLPDRLAFKNTDKPIATDLDLLSDLNKLWLYGLYSYMDNQGPLHNIEDPSSTTIVLGEGNNLILLPLSNLKVLAEKGNQLPKMYSVFEKLFETRTVADTKALENVEESDTPISEESTDNLNQKLAALGKAGALSEREQKRLITLSEKTETLEDPITGKPLSELKVIKKEDLKVKSELPSKVNDKVIQKSSQGSTVTNLAKDYVNNVMTADITNAILSLKNAGYIVSDYDATDVVTASNNFKDIRIKITPIEGVPSTIPIQIPNVGEDGTFISDGIRQTMDLQRVDVPIRKVKADKVALTSYFGKLFVSRSTKAVNSFSRWITSKLTTIGLDADDNRVSEVQFGGEEIPKEKLPRTYTALLENVTSFKAKGAEYYFAYSLRKEKYGEESVDKAEKNGHVVCGKKGNNLITINKKNIFHIFDGKDYSEIGSIGTVLEIDWANIPLDIAEVGVMGKRIPVTLLMAFYKGLTKYLKESKIPYRIIPTGKKVDLKEKELRISFKDENLILDMSKDQHAMMFSGFRSVIRLTNQYNLSDMDKRDGLIALFTDMGFGGHVIRELDLIKDMFIDPITKELLEDMKEPTTVEGLFTRSTELLLTDDHPDETKPAFQRLRGYERFSGFIYLSLVEAIREHRGRPSRSRTGLSMPYNEVWRRITSDPTVQNVEDTNPIQTLKEQEAVSLTGEGGRTQRTMVARSRVFHEDDLGVISESSPDSAKVGVKTYLSPNANLTSLRGTMGGYTKDSPISSVLSSTAQILPAANHDDKLLLSSLNLFN